MQPLATAPKAAHAVTSDRSWGKPSASARPFQGAIANTSITSTSDIPSPRYDFRRIPISPATPGEIRAKLTIDAPGDHYEQEADRVANQVMRMPAPQLQRECACGGSCSECRKGNQVHQHPRLQRKSAGGSSLGPTEAPPLVHEVLRSPGQPLDAATRTFMEPRFGHDFGRVRVHTDAAGARSAEALHARAYTVGARIVFANGLSDRTLLAHELAHVVQQDGRGPAIQRSPDPDAEREAAIREANKAIAEASVTQANEAIAEGFETAESIAKSSPRPITLGAGPGNTCGGSKCFSDEQTHGPGPASPDHADKAKSPEVHDKAYWLNLYYNYYTTTQGFSHQILADGRERLMSPKGTHLMDIDRVAPKMTNVFILGDDSYSIDEFNFETGKWDEVSHKFKQVETYRKLSIPERIGIGVSVTSKMVGGAAICAGGTVFTDGFGAVAACAYGADVETSAYDELQGGPGRTLSNKTLTRGLSEFVDDDTAQRMADNAEFGVNIMFGAATLGADLPSTAFADSLNAAQAAERMTPPAPARIPIPDTAEITSNAAADSAPAPVTPTTQPVRVEPVTLAKLTSQKIASPASNVIADSTSAPSTTPKPPVRVKPVRAAKTATQKTAPPPAKLPVKADPVAPARTTIPKPVILAPNAAPESTPATNAPPKAPVSVEPVTPGKTTTPKPPAAASDITPESMPDQKAPGKQPISDTPVTSRDELMQRLQDESRQLSNEATAADPEVTKAKREFNRLSREAEALKNELASNKLYTRAAVDSNPELQSEYLRVKALRKQLRVTSKALAKAEAEFDRLNAAQQARYARINAIKLQLDPTTWQEAEDSLRAEFGGRKQTFDAGGGLGERDIDCFTSDRMSREAKFGGPHRLSNPQLQEEIAKDKALIKSGQVKGVEWHFYKNAKTGFGPDGPLRAALDKAGIRIVEHR